MTDLLAVGLWQLSERADHDDPFAAAVVAELRRLYCAAAERIPSAIAAAANTAEYAEQPEFWFGVLPEPETPSTDPGGEHGANTAAPTASRQAT